MSGRGGLRTRLWAGAALGACLLCATGPVAGMAASEPAQVNPVAGPGPKSESLGDSMLEDVLERVEDGKRVPRSMALVDGEQVRLEVLGEEGLRRAVESWGGIVVASAPGLVLADVPAGNVEGLSAAAGVVQVRLPLDMSAPLEDPVVPEGTPPGANPVPQMRLGADSSANGASGAKGAEVLVKTRINAWHDAGFTGAGIKVGIIDSFNGQAWNAAAGSGDLPASPAGAICLRVAAGCGSTFWTGDVHGVGVAEIIHDMAPSAQLYLASASGVTDLRSVIDYFASQGVRVISRSQTSPYDGPGNGAGDMDIKVVDYAVSKGMTWINSAGNSAGNATRPGGYYRTTWNDPNGNGWLDFADGKEFQGFYCNPGGTLFLGLRWSDWGANKTDYDLYVYDTTTPGEAPYASFRLDQATGGFAPVEGAGFSPAACGENDWDYFAVQLDPRTNGTTGGDVLEMMGNQTFLTNWNNPYSATQPASDSANPGAAAVGAVDPLAGTDIAAYSSWGPTNDGRMKPDLSASAGISSVSYPGAAGFTGTSAATPVVSGAAAVVLGREPGLTPSQLVARMKSYVADRGTAGPDNVYGTGELTMPGLPASTPASTPAPTPAAAAAPSITSASFRPVMRKVSKRLAVNVSWDVATPQASAVVARSVNRGKYKPVAAITGPETSARVQVLLGKVNQLAVGYADAAGTPSPFVSLSRVVPTVYDDRHRAMKFGRGWRPVASAKAWGRTLTATNSAASRARLSFRGMSASLVMTKSANSGAARIFVDGRSVGRVSLKSRRTEYRKVVMNLYAAGKGKHVVEIQPLSRGRRGWVYVDGIVVLR